ncbi:MAG: patatin-like phospholipase family protein [Synechococcales bacterium]|nr:patatin-like phospholipase family protein [Synechococcales bacterium]
MDLLKQGVNRPKRLLSLDGGGIRGIIAAEVLIRMEDLLRAHNPNWTCLADYFDFIGGTSTGSILAAALAKGMSARQVRDFYIESGSSIFRKRWNMVQRFWSTYSPQALEAKLQEEFQDTELGSEKLKTLLLIVAKNATTGETWFFVNNPKGRYYKNDKALKLRDLIRASSAAPTFFPPHPILTVSGKYEFIDGGMSMFNNPSFQLFLEATKPEYNVGWETGADKVLLISVGTGSGNPAVEPVGRVGRFNMVDWARYAASTLMDDANLQQNAIINLISYQPRSQTDEKDAVESLVNPMRHVELTATNQLLTYHRYTVALTPKRLQSLRLGNTTLGDIDANAVSRMDNVEEIANFRRIGQAIAHEQVDAADFAGFLHP